LKTDSIPAENIIGKCYVLHPSAIDDLESWLCHVDHFYVQNYSSKPPFITIEAFDGLHMMDSSAHSYCEECYKEHIKALAKQDSIYSGNQPLKALELFSGAFTHCA
jgi:hypothetical protein